jgi:hypothetical protein
MYQGTLAVEVNQTFKNVEEFFKQFSNTESGRTVIQAKYDELKRRLQIARAECDYSRFDLSFQLKEFKNAMWKYNVTLEEAPKYIPKYMTQETQKEVKPNNNFSMAQFRIFLEHLSKDSSKDPLHLMKFYCMCRNLSKDVLPSAYELEQHTKNKPVSLAWFNNLKNKLNCPLDIFLAFS